MTDTRILATLVLAAIGSGCARPHPTAPTAAGGPCVPVATWVAPVTRTPVDARDVIDAARTRRIVLLGERHDWAEDHRWQAYVLSMLHASHPKLLVAFEAFTPTADPALARWSAGERSATEFLADVDWKRTWSLPPELYMPVFDVGRLLGLELRGINVDRSLVRRVATGGFAALPPAEQSDLPHPLPASHGYRVRLGEAWTEHRCRPASDGDPAFERFVEAQRTWDAVMAAALARLADQSPEAIVVGIVGRGHVEHGDGIVADLAARGHGALALLPWDTATDCADLAPDLADAVFGITPLASERPTPPPSPCDDASASQRPR